MKRRIAILMCCLAVMGMFSVSVLPVQAAACTHEYYFLNADALYDSYHNDIGHYVIRGNKWVCASCGKDSYWENLQTYYTGAHTYVNGTCTSCGHTKK